MLQGPWNNFPQAYGVTAFIIAMPTVSPKINGMAKVLIKTEKKLLCQANYSY